MNDDLENQVQCSQLFDAEEDEVVDELLSALRSARFENLKLNYERGELSAERTDLVSDHDPTSPDQESTVTYALAASWAADDNLVELILTVDEVGGCAADSKSLEICQEVMSVLRFKLPLVPDPNNPDRTHANRAEYNSLHAEFGS